MAERTDREETDLPAKRQMTCNQYSPLFSSDDYGYGESLAQQCSNYMTRLGDDRNESSLLDFLRVICLCHDVTKVTDAKGKSFLTGPSQDELCLLDMAAKTGLVEFVDRNSATFTIKVNGQIEEYQTVKFYDFTSARKMMTRVVQNSKTGNVMVISKGADSAILSKCIPRQVLARRDEVRSVRDQGMANNDLDEEERDILNQIEQFAAEGFRTLTFAYKELESAEIDGVLEQEDIESCLSLLGATCVEDLLQVDVSRCLVDFKRAGIQTWMLTGDKGKTAKMIGVQCGMFSSKIDRPSEKQNKEMKSPSAVGQIDLDINR